MLGRYHSGHQAAGGWNGHGQHAGGLGEGPDIQGTVGHGVDAAGSRFVLLLAGADRQEQIDGTPGKLSEVNNPKVYLHNSEKLFNKFPELRYVF